VCGIVEDDVAFGPENLGLPVPEIERRVDEVLGVVGLSHLRSASIHGLSAAQKQLIAVAGAMAIHPRYLILDEVTSRLDDNAAHDLLHAVTTWAGDRQAGIIMITHQLSELLKADWVCRLEVSPEGSGRVAICDRPGAVLRDAKLSEGVLLRTPLYDTVYHLENLGVHLNELPDSVGGLVELLCR
jgi:energy-coupling factor transport system ATP-binding protein